MSDSPNLSIDNRLGSITRPVAKNKTFNVSSLDFATVVDYFASWRDHDLRRIKRGGIKLRVADRDEDLVCACRFADALHLG